MSIFKVIPAVDLKNGRCVQLVQGVPTRERVSIEDPVGVAMRWVEEGAEALHIIDLDGAIGGVRANKDLVDEIIRRSGGVEVQVGGGIRTHADVTSLLEIGVERVIIGTAAIQNPEFVRDLSDEFGKRHITVALDARDGKVTTHGWREKTSLTPPEYAREFERLGAGSILFTNIETEGMLQGVRPEPTAELVRAVRIPVIGSGGITTLEDVAILKESGVCGVVIGTALYLERFSLEDAMKV